MTDGLMPECYNNVPIIVDRYENSCTRVLAVDAVRHPNRPKLRAYTPRGAWTSQLTPQNIALQRRTVLLMPWETPEDWENIEKLKENSPLPLSHAAMARYYFGHPQPLIDVKIDFIPKVENPDPAQLEKLKTMDGREIMDTLRQFAEDALFTSEIRVDIPNKRVKE